MAKVGLVIAPTARPPKRWERDKGRERERETAQEHYAAVANNNRLEYFYKKGII